MVSLAQLVRVPDCGSGGHRVVAGMIPKFNYGRIWEGFG